MTEQTPSCIVFVICLFFMSLVIVRRMQKFLKIAQKGNVSLQAHS